MRPSPILLAILAALPACALAQTIELRIVQESDINSSPLATPLPHTPAEPTRSYAVQARVPAGFALGTFYFDITILNEADTRGTLARLRIQNADGSAYSGPPTTSTSGGGRIGMAYQYTYFVNLISAFGGLINTSGGDFMNNPGSQEIGLINGFAAGAPVLSMPIIDPLGEGNPSTWSGYGAGATPAEYATAPIDPTFAHAYLAQNGFMDVYRFRYTVTDLTPRTLNITLARQASIASRWEFNSGLWAVPVDGVGASTLTPLSVQVGSFGACCQGAHCSLTDAPTCSSLSGQFHGSSSVCGTPGNPTTCCAANFDGINGLAVQDVFAFINAWFAADPRADFNGGGLAISDIFDFLNAWFAGCS